MYQLCDITGYTFLYSIENTKCKSSYDTFECYIFKPNCIEYNNFDLIIIYENLFKRFIVNTIAISTKQ